MPGSSTRNEVGSSSMLSASSIRMDQCHFALALAIFQQAVRLWGLLTGKDFRDIGIDRPTGDQRHQISHAARPHVWLTIGIEDTKPGPAQALGPQLSSTELRRPRGAPEAHQ